MDQSTYDFFLNQPIQINLIGFIQSLIAASILCFIIQVFYIKFSNSLSNKRIFQKFYWVRPSNNNCNNSCKIIFSFITWSSWSPVNRKI